mmetsp:Transcript_24417/g.41931  ORF Transcript_24417/g.41931 Transcript_24417/m.41931 type:complete len:98 (+) Transcript_24417:245-538(+)
MGNPALCTRAQVLLTPIQLCGRVPTCQQPQRSPVHQNNSSQVPSTPVQSGESFNTKLQVKTDALCQPLPSDDFQIATCMNIPDSSRTSQPGLGQRLT